jgi:N-acyl-D-amino-acid deacylase
MEDIIIKNGLISDGTSKKPYIGHIIINKGLITKLVSDIRNHNVSNHSDTYLTLFTNPSQKSLISQGVTTIIGGNCGASLAPLISNSAISSIQKWSNVTDINIDWTTVKEYLRVVKSKEFAPNFATLVGYDTVRRGLIGDSNRALVDSELQVILKTLDQSLSEGALGVSVGLAFSHMQSVDQNELLKISDLVKKHNKILTVHTRNDGEYVIESIQQIIDLVKTTMVKTHINHIKILGHKNWKYSKELNEMLNQAVEDKLPLTFDIFPYTANNTVAYVLLPSWVSLGGKAVLLKNLNDGNIRQRVIQDMKTNSYDYNRIIVSDSPMNKSIIGKTIVEIAKNQGLTVEDALIQLIIASGGRARVMVESISENHISELMAMSSSVIGSDSAGYDDSIIKLKGYEHPRSFGTFTKFLQEYNKENQSKWEKSIPKITSLPATIFGIENRGLILENMQADIVIIDPEKFESCANFNQPIQYSKGIEEVIINGRIAFQDGEVIDMPGQVITR